MRLPRFRIRTLMITIGVVALCLAYAVAVTPAVLTIRRQFGQVFVQFSFIFSLFYYPIAAIGGAGLWIEKHSDRGRLKWGLGRWTWAFCGVLILLKLVTILCFVAIRKAYHPYIDHLSFWGSIKTNAVPSFSRNPAPSFEWTACLVAAMASARWANAIHSDRLDACEWAGRIFLACNVLTLLVQTVLMAVDY